MAVRRQLRPVVPVILVTIALSSCGQKGGLYIPQDATSAPATAAAAPSAPAATAESAEGAAAEDAAPATPDTQE